MTGIKKTGHGRLFQFAGAAIFAISSLAFSVNSPYLISAEAKDIRSVLLNWRNNDVNAISIIILRKSGGAVWEVIDTASADSAYYTDITVTAGPNYEYALKALSSTGELSALSNILSVTTANAGLNLGVNKLAVSWDEEAGCAYITFNDESNAEEGFRICRRSALGGGFLSMDSIITSEPAYMGLRNDTDFSAKPNSWYEYQIRAFNGAIYSSSNTVTIYTHKRPPRDKGYKIKRISAFPIKPQGWIEKLGDSLFILENAQAGAEAISVIDIANAANPAFKGYLKPDSLPAHLSGTKIDAYGKFGVDANNELLYSAGYYLVATGFYLELYNSLTETPLARMRPSYAHSSLKEVVSDNYAIAKWAPGSADRLNAIYFGPPGIIDTLGIIAVLSCSGAAGHSSCTHYWGTVGGNSYSIRSSYASSRTPQTMYEYSIKRFPNRFEKIIYYTKEAGITGKFGGSTTSVFDDGVVFCLQYLKTNGTVYAFDIRDDRSGPDFHLGSYVDIEYKWGNIRHSIVDSAKHHVYVFSEEAFSVYEYEKTTIAANYKPDFHQQTKRIQLVNLPNGHIGFRLAQKSRTDLRANIFSAKGRLVKTISLTAGGTAIWDKTSTSGHPAASGFYIARIKSDNSIESIRFLIR